jgi:ethanolamine utilization protein EutQ (cupin superfamily)
MRYAPREPLAAESTRDVLCCKKEPQMQVILKKASEIRTEPFDAGEGKLSLVDIGRSEIAPLTAGMAEIWRSAPIEFEYDSDCAVCFMLEGEVTLTEAGESMNFQPGDVAFIPQRAGLKVVWESPSYGRFYYVTYPHWR